MDLNMILDAIGTIATIETRIREAIGQHKKNKSIQRIENIDVEIKLKELQGLNDYLEEHVDEYITKHASSFKNINLSKIFSEDEKEKYVSSFFGNNKDFNNYRETISNILYGYINQIEGYISESLTEGEKFIVKKVNQVSEQINKVDVQMLENLEVVKSMSNNIESIKEKVSISNIFRESTYSESIIELLNIIFVIIEENTDEKLLKKKLQLDYLKAGSLEDVILKIQRVLSLIDKDKIENITKQKFDNGLHALHIYIQYIATDFANKLNMIFIESIQLVIDCIYSYEYKDSKYYLTLGAMGLRNNHSDENIYSYVMDNLVNYLFQLSEVLKEKWKDRNYEVIEDLAVEEMQQYLWYQIKSSITEKNKEWIMEIVNNDNITDVDLAMMFNVSVNVLRKELYSATKTFLYHRYVDDHTTSLIINDDYKKVIIIKLSSEV